MGLGRKSLQRNAAVGGEGAEAGGAGGPVDDPSVLCLAGARHLTQLPSQRTALAEVPGSPRQFRVVPFKRCSVFLMGVENLLPRQG